MAFVLGAELFDGQSCLGETQVAGQLLLMGYNPFPILRGDGRGIPTGAGDIPVCAWAMALQRLFILHAHPSCAANELIKEIKLVQQLAIVRSEGRRRESHQAQADAPKAGWRWAAHLLEVWRAKLGD